jgi:hypothetical protein
LITSEVRDDRAHLLETCRHEECWGTPIALDTDREVIWLGMCELAVAVRGHRTTGMHVWVDCWTKPTWAFQPRIEVKPQLSRQSQVRPLPGYHDDTIDRA